MHHTMMTGGKKVSSKGALLRVVLPVTITIGPKSQTMKAGQNAVFRVAVKGTGPYTYQWYFNGTPIGSFNSAIKAQSSDAEPYGVAVSYGASIANAVPEVLSVE